MELIRIDDVCKRMGDHFALGPLNLTVRQGEVLGVMGPNGAGKSTLLRLLWGFLRPDRGEIRISGMTPHIDQVRMRQRAGYMPENPAFYDWMTARQYLRFVGNFYPNWDRSRAEQWLYTFDIRPDAALQSLSRGNRVRVALICALSHDPEVLLLDEPTSGLDPLVRLEILTFLEELASQKGTAIVLSSHVSDDLDRIAHRVLMLAGGRVIELDAAKRLMEKHGHTRLEDVFLHAIGTARPDGRLDHRQRHR